MKTLASSLLRALCAIAVGALLVKYREQTVEWITIAIGVLFFVSGVFSCATYFVAGQPYPRHRPYHHANGVCKLPYVSACRHPHPWSGEPVCQPHSRLAPCTYRRLLLGYACAYALGGRHCLDIARKYRLGTALRHWLGNDGVRSCGDTQRHKDIPAAAFL